MQDYWTNNRRAWLRKTQRSMDFHTPTNLNPITEFLGALAVFVLPFLLLFLGALFGL